MFETLKSQLDNSAIMRWYAGREPNEQPIIAALAGLVGLLILWGLIWQPVSDWQNLEQNRYANAQSLWDWVQANEQDARAAARSSSPGVASQRSLLPVITRAANTRGLKLSRLQPESDGAVSVVLQAQPFNDMLEWLAELEQRSQVSVQRITLDAEGQPGLINAQVRLQ